MIHITKAKLSDLDEIYCLEQTLFVETAWSKEQIREELSAQTRDYWVAKSQTDSVVGYVGLLTAGAQSDIQTIALAPESRGQGLGERLLHLALKTAKKKGAHETFLEVRTDNIAAKKLYEKNSFEVIDVRKNYYEQGVDALVMRLKLNRHDEPPVILGIETSCDETGVGLVRGRKLLANVIASSMNEHARFGGVVPEIAARAHLEAITPTLNAALEEAQVSIEEVDAIAVTAGPGLAGALMVGVAAAKSLAVATKKPLYAVNHLVGHVSADILSEEGEIEFPQVALLVSGGHTSLLLVRDLKSDVELLGETIDDAAGEAFDKVARLLGLPYPGGPHIDRVAESGNPNAIRFPRGLSLPKDQAKHRFNFSFSGLKTSVSRWVEKARQNGDEINIPDVAASFREAVADVLTAKAIDACQEFGVSRLLLGGGVAANKRVRELAQDRAEKVGIELRIPPLKLCTDNGAMMAALGAELYKSGAEPSDLMFSADSTLPVTSVQI